MTGLDWGAALAVVVGLLVFRGVARQLFLLFAVALTLIRLAQLAVT